MTIEKKIENGNVTIKVSGRLDTTTAPELEKALDSSIIDILLLLAAPVFAVMIRVSVMTYNGLELPTFLRLNPGLKIATGVFDVGLSVLGALFVWKLTRSKRRAFLTYAILLLLPTDRKSTRLNSSHL